MKTLEKPVTNHILSFLEDHSLLSPHQYGFRAGLSCTSQLLHLLHTWASALDKGTVLHTRPIFGPVLFLMYASGLFKVADKHITNIHTYDDDTQLYLSFKLTSQANAVNTIEKCIAVVRDWMASNRLFINDSKTKFMIIGSRKQLAKISVDSVTVGDAIIKPVRNICTKSW